MVVNSLVLVLLGSMVFIIGKSLYDLVQSKNLTPAEKVSFGFIIPLFPIVGSFVFYFYDRNRLRVKANAWRQFRARQ